jgi:hypothetical protein
MMSPGLSLLSDILLDNIMNKKLAKYFGGVWKEDMSFTHSGESLIKTVNDLQPSKVLDVGCGYNFFKNKIHNLIGIDPYNSNADIMIRIEDYNSNEKYDVILALGSINFGSKLNINNQLYKLDKLLAPGGRIFFRVNPGLEHHWAKEESKGIDFFPWNLDFIAKYIKHYNYSFLEFQTEYNKHGSKRFYFVVQKS